MYARTTRDYDYIPTDASPRLGESDKMTITLQTAADDGYVMIYIWDTDFLYHSPAFYASRFVSDVFIRREGPDFGPESGAMKNIRKIISITEAIIA